MICEKFAVATPPQSDMWLKIKLMTLEAAESPKSLFMTKAYYTSVGLVVAYVADYVIS